MTTTSDDVQSASATISKLGSEFYFVPETLEAGKAHGLDGLRFYVLGRGGVLGDVEAPVVVSAFGYFEPGLIDNIWNSAKERADVSPRECARVYLECAAEFGRRRFANVPGLQAFCDAAERVHRAVNPAGLALYSGYVAEPLADDPPGRAMQLVTILREFLGSAHLVAVLAVGLEPKVAHGVRRPEMWESFGYGGEPVPADTPEARGLLADADALTQRLVAPAFAVLSGSELAALRTGLDALTAAAAA